MIAEYTAGEFDRATMEVFRYQAINVPVYREFLHALNVDPGHIRHPEQIPFLPVELFKSRQIIDRDHEPEIIFESSGTTGMVRSRHFVADKELYRRSFTAGFERFYGPVSGWCILALLPSYLEREGSSLVYMVQRLIRATGHPDSGFFLHDHDALMRTLRKLQKTGQKTILLGVSFALTDLAESIQEDLSNIIIMETGGMKGRKKEMLREEVHTLLKKSFNVTAVHSEYGMTELLSQAYSSGQGVFHTPPWMKIMIRDSHDPFALLPPGNAGLINIIDLANIHSCSFISTADLGQLNNDGSFEVLGRMDNADIRGCNLLIA